MFLYVRKNIKDINVPLIHILWNDVFDGINKVPFIEHTTNLKIESVSQ